MARTYTYDQAEVKANKMEVMAEIMEVARDSGKAKKFSERKYQMLLKLAPTVFPRTTELTGEGGGAIKISQVLDDIEQSRRQRETREQGVEDKQPVQDTE